MIKIADRYNNSCVLHEVEAETQRDAVLKLVGSEANLSRADLSWADLSWAHLSWADLSEANLLWANLTGANLSGADLSGANLAGANLTGANLTGADLSEANLSGADLTRADLSWADLTGADLSGAHLTGADLSGAHLAGANLAGANLTRANLAGANLSGANLTRADLSWANLTRADLSWADLSWANLAGANLTGANLDPIRTDLHEVLSGAPFDVLGLLEALCAGKIDGSSYAGTCACLVGTLENVARARACPVRLPHRSDRPAERWFLALQPGHTPENHPVAKITEAWISDWLTAWAKESPELYAKAAGEAKQREIVRLEARLAELRG